VLEVYDEQVAAQSPAELREALALYVASDPKVVLEIGCLHGGTLRCWLQNASPEVVVAIDPNHHMADLYGSWCQATTQLYVGRGHSQFDSMLELMTEHAPYDWVFIDGDHSLEAVRADAYNVLPLMNTGGYMLFHDVHAPPSMGWDPTPPRQVWEEVARVEGRRSWVIAAPRPQGYPPESANGIGVVAF
jgi:predicted O-methyltransferase YrrM